MLLRILLLFLATFGIAAAEPAPAVGLQPLGTVTPERVAAAKKEIETSLGLSVKVLPAQPLPKAAWYAPRSRYRAEKLLDHLTATVAKEHRIVVGLTEKDISTTKGENQDWGIIGLGELSGRSCVVSTFRLSARGAGEAALRERLAKMVVHEIGHVLGLDHCPEPTCVMRDLEGSIDTVDRGSGDFCPDCRGKIDLPADPD